MTIRRIDLSSLEAQRAWDVRAVDAPGGDVHQGSAWLTYRASLGREAVALEIDDAPLGILLNRAPLFGLPKGHAPRGPLVPWGASLAQGVAAAERIQRAATWLGAEYGLVSLDADPWLPAGEATEAAFRNAGLQKSDEIFPSQQLVATERAEILAVRGAAGALVAFIVILRHGERITTDASGDDPIARKETPGALALLRWTAIKIAAGERRITDLGGVDVAGHREIPVEGEAMHGLYAHKASFGATWTPMAGAHRIVLRPRALRLRSLLGRVRGGR